MSKTNWPQKKHTWHNTDPPQQLHWFRIILEKLATIPAHHTNRDATLRVFGSYHRTARSKCIHYTGAPLPPRAFSKQLHPNDGDGTWMCRTSMAIGDQQQPPRCHGFKHWGFNEMMLTFEMKIWFDKNWYDLMMLDDVWWSKARPWQSQARA